MKKISKIWIAAAAIVLLAVIAWILSGSKKKRK